jgi:hypothetical protein
MPESKQQSRRYTCSLTNAGPRFLRYFGWSFGLTGNCIGGHPKTNAVGLCHYDTGLSARDLESRVSNDALPICSRISVSSSNGSMEQAAHIVGGIKLDHLRLLKRSNSPW